MGKTKILFFKNRCQKIARNKLKRKNRKYRTDCFKRKELLKRAIRKNKVQKTFETRNFFEKVKIHERAVSITIPQNFSLLSNPEETIVVLKKVNYIFEKSSATSIDIDYGNCKELGLAASVLTDLIILNGLEYRRKLGDKIEIKGNQPISYSAGEIFWNSGLLKHLKLSKIEDPKVERLDPFSMDMNDENDATNRTLKYINKCLLRNGYTLNDKGIDYFNKLVGEIIGNAKEHSGQNGSWYVSGHFTQKDNLGYGKGSLVFISIGNTIYENLKFNVKDDGVKKRITNHLKFHKKIFDWNWNEETSTTVFGLQYKISSEKDSENPDRGTGTIKFIDSFTQLGKTINGETPKMVIVSGNTHILFDGTYNLKTKTIKGQNIQIIAFNEENNLKKRPNSKYVKYLKNGFPGVIISLEFYLDKRYLDRFKEDNNDRN